jgi:hypothetical protein
MRRPGPILVLTVGVLLAASAALAAGRADLPHRFLPSTDRGLIQATNPVDGSSWSIWSYRNGAEFDLAVSTLNDRGYWSEPTFIGSDDGLSQIQPAMVVTDQGVILVAYAEVETGRVMLTGLIDGSWTTPRRMSTEGTRARGPAMLLVGDQLIIAYVEGGATKMQRLSVNRGISTHTNEGPDPVGRPPEDDGGDDDEDATEDIGSISSITDGKR